MTYTAYLISKGWRLVGRGGEKKQAKLWDHPCHQPARRGCFTTSDAFVHQRFVDKYGHCRCLSPEGGNR